MFVFVTFEEFASVVEAFTFFREEDAFKFDFLPTDKLLSNGRFDRNTIAIAIFINIYYELIKKIYHLK